MLTILAAAAALTAAPTSGPATPVNILPAPSQWPRFVEQPGPAAFAAVYPHGAAAVGMSGRATLHCEVAEGGRLAKCQVESEAPEGAGFGEAALNLARSYRLDPGGETAQLGSLDLPISFAISINDDQLTVAGPWLSAPTFADVGAAYPDIGGGVVGQAVLHCALERDGALKSCKTLYLRPADRDFDVAALKLVHLFRMRIDPSTLRNYVPMNANVLLRMASPFRDEAKDRQVSDPIWLARPDPAHLEELYPAQATAKGVTRGLGLADCTVAIDGALGDCQPGAGDPPSLGFSEAAVKAAQVMRMSPWTGAGGPVDGARVRIPVRFTEPPPAK